MSNETTLNDDRRNVHKFLYSIIKILEKSETKEVRRFITEIVNT
jgi:hypothetical protein